MRKTHIAYLLVASLIVASIFATPLLTYCCPDAAALSYKIHSYQCHQIPSRSPFLFNRQLPECWRCTAIFVSFLVGVILVARYNAKAKWWMLALATIPIAFDGFTQLRGIRESTNLLRFATGSLFGLFVALWTLPFITKLIDWLKKWKRRIM